jgi:hypothetical protein
MKRLLFFVTFLAAVLLAGCDTFARRSKEKAATFETLSPEQREKLKRGVIELGNSQDMVYIALGRPDETRETDTPAGHETVWIYNSYHREYEGNFQTGYRRILVYDAARRRYFVYYDPIYTDVYSEHEDEHIRIVFREGRVVQIEQPKPRT